MNSHYFNNIDFNTTGVITYTQQEQKESTQKKDKVKLATTPPDSFEKSVSPRTVATAEEKTTHVKPSQPEEQKHDILPLVLGSLGAATGIVALAVSFLKKPSEAETFVDEVAQASIKKLENQVSKLTNELREKATKGDLETLNNTVTSEMNQLSTKLDNTIEKAEQQGGKILDLIYHQDQHYSEQRKLNDGLNVLFSRTHNLERDMDLIPRVGNGIVSPEIKALFRPLENGKNVFSKVLQLSKQQDNGETKTKSLQDLITMLFEQEDFINHPGTLNPLVNSDFTWKPLVNSNSVAPYQTELKNLDYILSSITKIYDGKPEDIKPSSCYNHGGRSYSVVPIEEVFEKAQIVVKTAHTGDINATKQAHADLMNWLKGEFTKSKDTRFIELYPKAIRELPPIVSDAAWLNQQKLLTPDKTFAELSQTILGDGFTSKEHAEMLQNPTTLLNTVEALQQAFAKAKPDATVESNGKIILDEDNTRSTLTNGEEILVSVLNRFASVLTPLNSENIEQRLTLPQIIPYNWANLHDEFMNARLSGDEKKIEALTQEMFKKLRNVLADCTLNFPENTSIPNTVTEHFEYNNQLPHNPTLKAIIEATNANTTTNHSTQEALEALINEMQTKEGHVASIQDTLYQLSEAEQFKRDTNLTIRGALIDLYHYIVHPKPIIDRSNLAHNLFGDDYPKLVQRMQAVLDTKTKDDLNAVKKAEKTLSEFIISKINDKSNN